MVDTQHFPLGLTDANLKFVRTTRDKVDEVSGTASDGAIVEEQDGQLMICVDTQELFLDYLGSDDNMHRIKIGTGQSIFSYGGSAGGQYIQTTNYGNEVFNNYINIRMVPSAGGWPINTVGAKNTTQSTNTQSCHAEGYYTHAGPLEINDSLAKNISSAQGAHSEGYCTLALPIGSHAEGYYNEAVGNYSHVEGEYNAAAGSGSHAEGYNSRATGDYAHAEGYGYYYQGSSGAYGYDDKKFAAVTGATGQASHVEGYQTTATSNGSHAEGRGDLSINSDGTTQYMTGAFGEAAHSEGYRTYAAGTGSHAEGYGSVISSGGSYSYKGIATAMAAHAEGYNTQAHGQYSHAEGGETLATGYGAHAEGYGTQATNNYSHAEGLETKAMAGEAHAEGYQTTASGNYSHAEGQNTTASGGYGSHAEGYYTVASYNDAHAEGDNTKATNIAAHAEGEQGAATGRCSHVEGAKGSATGTAAHKEGGWHNVTYTEDGTSKTIAYEQLASGYGAHAEGTSTRATGDSAHAEGYGTATYNPTTQTFTNFKGIASGNYSHSEGQECVASSQASHAEGQYTVASYTASHAEGSYATASGLYSHAEGRETRASGYASHAGGTYTRANSNSETAIGRYNTLGTDIIEQKNQLGSNLFDSSTATIHAYFAPSSQSIVEDANCPGGVTDFIDLSQIATYSGSSMTIDLQINCYSTWYDAEHTSSYGIFAIYYDENKTQLGFSQIWGSPPTPTDVSGYRTLSYSSQTKYVRLSMDMTDHISDIFIGQKYTEDSLFVIGNGSDNNNRNYIFQATDKSININGSILYQGSTGINLNWQVPSLDNYVLYKVGSIVIHDGGIYICTVENSDTAWDATHWNMIGITNAMYTALEARVAALENA